MLADASGGEEHVVQAPVVIVLASTYWRNAWKYQRRAYRHVFWDGGTIVAQLLAQAAADGWPARIVLGFADRAVEQFCALDREREGVVALICIGGGAPAPAPAEPPALRLETEPLSRREVSYRRSSKFTIRGRSKTVGRRRPGDAAPQRRAPSNRRARRSPSAPATTFPRDDLDAVIRRRGSTRAFDRRAISRAALHHLLAAASAAVPADYRPAPEQSLVDLYLVVNAVEGIEPGAYRWRPRERRLECLWRGERRRDAGTLALGQALGADAAVDVYAIADLDDVLSSLGTRGYRAATLDGGVAGGRIYLAAYADRLGATGLTFFDDDVARFFGLDRETLRRHVPHRRRRSWGRSYFAYLLTEKRQPKKVGKVGASLGPRAGRELDEGTHQALLCGVVELHLGVPLHGDARRVDFVLHRFDDAVLRPRHGLQTWRQPGDPLMVPRANRDLERAKLVGEPAAGCHARQVMSVQSFRQAMLDGAAAEIGKVGMERPAECHVQHLHAAADAEEGQLGARHRRASERDLEVVALFRHPVDHVVRVSRIAFRGHVTASREDEAVEAVEQSSGVALSGR